MWNDAERRRVVPGGGAVPAVVPELPLTLEYSELGPSTHAGHVVLVKLTEADLSGRKHLQFVADRLRAEEVQLRIPPYVELSGPETPVNPHIRINKTCPVVILNAPNFSSSLSLLKQLH